MTNLNDVLLAMSNIPVDDPIAEIWGRGLQGGRYTVIEYTGALPITINANGESLIDYRIYGNTVQNGTPTPENPIMPIGCGERTENLCDENNINQGYYAYADGQYGNIGTWVNTYYIAIKGGTEYTAKFKTIYNRSRWYGFVWYDSNKQYISTTNTQDNPYGCELTATSPANASFCIFNICSQSTTEGLKPTDVIYFMLNTGSTALPYEPYGYKLPILSNSTVTNIYLGEVETTRRIKKLVLTGEETFRKNSDQSTNYLYYAERTTILPGSMDKTPVLCNELPVKDGYPLADIGINTSKNYLVVYLNFGADVMNTQSSGNTIAGLKEYLAAQYAAGTPVTVWYVLAEPETGVVNEPLMKIEDYADTVSMEQAGVSIPTNKGSTVIDYDGATKPSQMYIKYQGVKND